MVPGSVAIGSPTHFFERLVPHTRIEHCESPSNAEGVFWCGIQELVYPTRSNSRKRNDL